MKNTLIETFKCAIRGDVLVTNVRESVLVGGAGNVK